MRRLIIVLLVTLVVPSAASAALILGAPKVDRIKGTKRADLVDVVGGGRDTVSCRGGRDVVTADSRDRVARDCEVVTRRISIDTQRGPGEHQTEVEPTVAAAGDTVVSVFQVGRFFNGASEAIGWATSRDAGRTWRSGVLPGLTLAQRPAGPVERVSDPAVAYDALHSTWLAVSLGVGANSLTNLGVNRSADGITWTPPVFVAQARIGSLAYDKEWIGCDNGTTSRFAGSCYVVYSDFVSDRLSVQVSRDGGATWSASINASSDAGGDVEGALPLVQPDGSVTIVFLSGDGVYAVRSGDGGATWGPRVGISPVNGSAPVGFRVPPLPAAAVDASGRLNVVWADCRFRAPCLGSDIVLVTSTDGVTWTSPRRVPGLGLDRFVPALAADPSRPGRLGLVYYWRASGTCGTAACVGAAYTRSDDGGTTWRASQRLNTRLLQSTWLAATIEGAFVGDYIGATFARSAFVPVFALAQPPTRGTKREAMFSARLP